MEIWNGSLGVIVGSTALLFISIGCSGNSPAAKTQGQSAAPKVTIGKAVTAKALTPVPGPGATKAASFSGIGKGKASISGAGRPQFDYASWSERIDIADEQKQVAAGMAMDNVHKVLYLNEERSFGCLNGSTANGNVLIAFYTAGNTLGKPVGSGWYVAELEAGVCGVPKAGLYGCRFGIDGRLTECGAAAFREVPDDIVITKVTAGPGARNLSKK
jgi:hypothetical protein